MKKKSALYIAEEFTKENRLAANLATFAKNLGISDRLHDGFIACHGDKCYGYREVWRKAGIPFEHGVAIYFLTYLRPWSQTVRNTETGWVDVGVWVVETYSKYKQFLPPPQDC